MTGKAEVLRLKRITRAPRTQNPTTKLENPSIMRSFNMTGRDAGGCVMEGEIKIVVQKVSALNRMLNVKATPLLRGLAEFTLGLTKVKLSANTSNLGKAIEGASEIISGTFTFLEGIFSDERDPVEHRAFKLLYNGIRRGMMILIHQHLDEIKEATGKGYDAVKYQTLIDQVEKKWGATTLEINYRFFEDCGSFAFWGAIQRLIRDWLLALGMEVDPAKEISLKLEPLICSTIGALIRERASYYQKIKDAAKDELGSALAWRRYRYKMKLIQQWEEDIFDEPFGLDKLYIPLNACLPFAAKPKQEQEFTHEVVPSEQYILDWLNNPAETSKILILRGGPGSGKSSLMKKIAREVALQNEREVYMVSLQRFTINDRIENSIQAYLQDVEGDWEGHPELFSSKQSKKGKSALLIFDGLDELSQSGKGGQELAGDFSSKLAGLLRDKSDWEAWDIRAIVTGRDFVVQKVAASTFGGKVPVLEMLPYSIGEFEFHSVPSIEGFERYRFHDPIQLLLANQREQWWQQYWHAKGQTRTDVPEEVREGEYAQLSRQPLLSYLLAFEYDKNRLTGVQNINMVYENLIDSLRTRKWGGKKGHRHSTFEDKENFFRLMEEIAVSAWHSGDVRMTNMNALKQRCENQKLEHLIKDFKTDIENAKTSLNDLVVSFFAKLHKADSEGGDLIEFSHKSFGEYLVARRLVGLAKEVAQTLLKRDKRSAENAQSDLLDTCATAILTAEIWGFVVREVQIKPRLMDETGEEIVHDAAAIQTALAEVFSTLINEGFDLKRAKNSLDVIYQSRNAEINLWMMISEFAFVSKKPTIIRWKDVNEPCRILGWTWFLSSLGFLGKGFHSVVFPEGVNLYRADLVEADLSGAVLRGAVLSGAVLSHADLSGAELSGAELTFADLSRAVLSGADLGGADLSYATIIGADLSSANLSSADLSSADLSSANLSSADLTNADLTDASCYAIRVNAEILDGQAAYDYLVSLGAKNVPLPPKEEIPEEF